MTNQVKQFNNKPITKFSNIKEVDYKDPSTIRTFMYDVDDGFYPDSFFSIDNINPNNINGLNHFLNILDINGRLQSTFVASPFLFNNKYELPDNPKIYKGEIIRRGKDGRKVVEENSKHPSDNKELRKYTKDKIRPGIVMGKMQPIENQSSAIDNNWKKSVPSFMFAKDKDGNPTSIRMQTEDNYKRDKKISLGGINPTFDYFIKQQIRFEALHDKQSKIIETISLKLKDLKEEERDEHGNITQPMQDAIWIHNIRVEFDPVEKDIKVSMDDFDIIKNSANYVGSSPDYNYSGIIQREMVAQIQSLGGDEITAKDILADALKLVKERVKTRNTKKVVIEA